MESDLVRSVINTIVNDLVRSTPALTQDRKDVIEGIRRRRRARRAWQSASALAVVGAVITAVAVTNRLSTGDATASAPQATPAAGSADRPGVTCGKPFTATYGAEGSAGVRIAITAVRATDKDAMPDIDVAVSADQRVQVSGSPQHLGIQVVVVHGGVVIDRIGGAPWPENYQPKDGAGGIGSAARSWPVDTGAPHIETITRSHWTACSGVDWGAIWADPAAYQLIAIMPTPLVLGPNGPIGVHSDALIGVSASLHAPTN